MQNLKFLLLLAAFALVGSLVACHDGDDHDEEDDQDPPTLTIDEPTENASTTGEIHIEGKVTDKSLHELSIKLTKDSDNSVLFSAAPTVHDKTEYSFHEHFTPTGITTETAVTLTVTVEDHSSHKVTKTVKFKAKS